MPEISFDSSSRTVQTADWSMHYNEIGEGHPVLLMHGSGAGATGWGNFKANIPALAERFHVHAVDAPGWGRSEAVTVERLNHVEAHIQLMDTLGIEKAALIGNSMGGVTALGMMTRYPDRVSHVVTMGSGSSRAPKLFSPGDGLSEGLKILFQCYREPTLANMQLLCEIMMFDKSNSEALGQERLDSALQNPEHLTNLLAGIPHGAPVPSWFAMDDLLKSTVPTMLIHGRDDRVVHYEHSLQLVSYIPNSRLVLLNRCGHWAQIEHPEEFNRLVIDFITNN